MNRVLLIALLAVALTASTSFGQIRLGSNGPETAAPAKSVSGTKTSLPTPKTPPPFRFNVTPAAEPDLPLKYSLLPEYSKLKAGNSVPFYYRAVISLKENNKLWGDTKFWDETWPRWTEGPIDQLPKAEMRKFVSKFETPLRELEVATFRDKTDWDWRIGDLDGISAINFLLPEVQEMRSFARLLNLKIRLEIAEGKWDDAIKSMQLGYKMGIDVAEPPTLINDLVGVAVGVIITNELREMINQPGSPNMYWALASLPRPYIDMRPALQYEMMLPVKLFPALKDPEKAEHSPEEWARLLSEAFLKMEYAERFSVDQSRMKLIQVRLATTALVLRSYSRVKRELVEWGYDPKWVNEIPVGKAVAIHQARTYRYMYQQMMKWSYLPYHEFYDGGNQAEKQLKGEGYFGPFGKSREVIPLASLFLPAVFQANKASARMDAKVAALRVVEAIRMHAAANKGQLPHSLDKISVVPVPVNPLTGKPFVYWVEGDKAILQVRPSGDTNFPSDWRQMEITIRKG